MAYVVITTAEVGGVEQPAAVRSELCDKGVAVAPEIGLHGVDGREVRRKSDPRGIGVAAVIDGDSIATVGVTAAEVGGIEQLAAVRSELRDEGVAKAPTESGLHGVDGREVGRTGEPRDRGVAAVIDGDS